MGGWSSPGACMRTSTHRRGVPTSTSKSTCDEPRSRPARPRSGWRWPANWAAKASATVTQGPEGRATCSRPGGSPFGLDLEVGQDAADGLVQRLAAVPLEQAGDQALPGLLRAREGAAVVGLEPEHVHGLEIG